MADISGKVSVLRPSSSGVRFPALSLIDKHPENAALISKLVNSREPNRAGIQRGQSADQLNQGQMYGISQETQKRITDNENIIQLFPDIELAIQILVSSILSPKDMVQTDIIYKFRESFLPPEVAAAFQGEVATQMEGHYKLKQDLPEILRDILFETGSHPKMILAEAAVDAIINQTGALSMESLAAVWEGKTNSPKPIGILGDPDAASTPKTALEALVSNSYSIPVRSAVKVDTLALESILEVTDNVAMLKMPQLFDRARSERIRELTKPKREVKLNVGMEAKPAMAMSNAEFRSVTYKQAQQGAQSFVRIPDRMNLKRHSIGRPLVMKVPSEAVIPVHFPGDPSAHIGYFVLTDAEGHFVTKLGQAGIMGQAQSLFANNINSTNTTQNSLTSMLIQKAKSNLVGNNKVTHLDQLSEIFGSIIEQDLTSRLKNGLYGQTATISKNEDIYRVMLARSMCSMMTRLVFVPKEQMTYFAFKYHDNGVGKSLLDDIKVLCSMRAILLFAKVQAEAKSAIAITDVTISLDPREPDPMKTIEVAMDSIAKTRQQYFPLGTNSPSDLLEWIHRAGFQFHFDGHPGLPDTKFQFETKNFQREIPNSELDEQLRKQTYMALGLPPELMDTGFDADFAATVTANNILLSKRVIQMQGTLSELLTDYQIKLSLNDMEIIDGLTKIMNDNWGAIEAILTEEEKTDFTAYPDKFKEKYLEKVINNIILELPKPDLTTINNQFEAFKKYEEAVEGTLDYWVSTGVLSNDIAGEVSNNIDSIRAVLKAHFMRQWMANNGFLTELGDIVGSTDSDKPALDIFNVNKQHMEGLIRNCLGFFKNMSPIKAAANTDIENLSIVPGEGGALDGGSDAGGTDDFGTDFGSDFGGEDLGTDTPPATLETPFPDATPEEGTTPEEGADTPPAA